MRMLSLMMGAALGAMLFPSAAQSQSRDGGGYVDIYWEEVQPVEEPTLDPATPPPPVVQPKPVIIIPPPDSVNHKSDAPGIPRFKQSAPCSSGARLCLDLQRN